MPETTDALDRLLDYQIGAAHYPGALVHVERDGTVLARRAAGRLRPDADTPMPWDALFPIASLTKPVVSAAAMMLVDEGRLELDAPVAEYLPEMDALRMISGERPRRAPSIRDLLRHTSGFGYVGEIRDAGVRALAAKANLDGRLRGMTTDEFVAALAALPLAVEPGTRFVYGLSTDVLGVVLEKLDGRPLGEVLRRRLFDPLGMRDTGFGVPAADRGRLAAAFASDAVWAVMAKLSGEPARMDSGGGGLFATIDDYARFARFIAAGGRLGEERLISAASFEEMARDQLPAGLDGPSGYTGPGFGFGLGFAVRLDWGAGAMPCKAGELAWSGVTGTALFVHPAERWFAVCFTCNNASRMMARMELRRALARL